MTARIQRARHASSQGWGPPGPARAARGFRPRPRRVVCARPAVRAAAGRLRVCAERERSPPSRFRAGCAPSTGVCTEILFPLQFAFRRWLCCRKSCQGRNCQTMSFFSVFRVIHSRSECFN
nr:UDP-GalNAc:beta-1,3-N-acetylgalactosaminyltransferase 1 isoform X2 [Macaca nemestrina]